MATLAALLVGLLRRCANPTKPPRARATDAVAALVVAVLLVANFVRPFGDDDRDDPWKNGQGAQMRAGFIDGCNSSTGGLVDCGCAFDRLTATPPYDTPAGLVSLAGPVRAAQRSGDPRDVPAVLVTAMRSCARTPDPS